MEKASFQFVSYRFTRAFLDFLIPREAELAICFNPTGVFNAKEHRYVLSFDIDVNCEETKSTIVNVTCEASFSFEGHITIEEIPEYFYPNSLAIVFPYVRAFISTLTLQANISPVVLPTINLVGLTDKLKQQTTVLPQE